MNLPKETRSTFPVGNDSAATNRFGNYTRFASLDVISRNNGDIQIEANYQNGSRAVGLHLTKEDCDQLRKLLDTFGGPVR